MSFHFYSSLFNVKLIFLPSPYWGKIQVAQPEAEGLAGEGLLPLGSVLPQSFLWQVLEPSCSSEAHVLGLVEQAPKRGGTNTCFYEMTTFRPRFQAELAPVHS